MATPKRKAEDAEERDDADAKQARSVEADDLMEEEEETAAGSSEKSGYVA